MPDYQHVIRGRGSLNRIMELAGKLGIVRPMIIGGNTLTTRLMKRVPALLAAPVFSGYHPNPDLSDAYSGAELYRKNACDGIISIGCLPGNVYMMNCLKTRTHTFSLPLSVRSALTEQILYVSLYPVLVIYNS